MIYYDPTGHLESKISLYINEYYAPKPKLKNYTHLSSVAPGFKIATDQPELKTTYYYDSRDLGGTVSNNIVTEYSDELIDIAIRKGVSPQEAYKQIENYNIAPQLGRWSKDVGLGIGMSFLNGGIILTAAPLVGCAYLTDWWNSANGVYSNNYGDSYTYFRDGKNIINGFVEDNLVDDQVVYKTSEYVTDMAQLVYGAGSLIKNAPEAISTIRKVPGMLWDLFNSSDDLVIDGSGVIRKLPSYYNGYKPTVPSWLNKIDSVDNAKSVNPEVGKNGVNPSEIVTNRKGNDYPKVEVEGYGEVPFPEGPYIPNNSNALRPKFTDAFKKQFKEWWINQGRPWPEGEVNIHHIKPLSKGGDNSFENLVPLVQPDQHQPFTNWWRSYP